MTCRTRSFAFNGRGPPYWSMAAHTSPQSDPAFPQMAAETARLQTSASAGGVGGLIRLPIVALRVSSCALDGQ